MALNTLWIAAWILAFTCLLTPGCGDVFLREGQPCGRYVSGHCESDLKCMPHDPPDEDSYSGGVCRRSPVCNCSEVQCPRFPNAGCRRSLVIDPCGCCRHCARQKGQVCAGPSWRWGYCENGLACVLVMGRELALPPRTGVCKELPGYKVNRFADPLCPWVYGCNIHVGNCDCYSEQTCQSAFSYNTYEDCHKTWLDLVTFDPSGPELESEMPELPKYNCKEWNCEVQDCQCVCQKRTCDYHRPAIEEKGCCDLLKEATCPNRTCPEVSPPPCPADSFLTEPYVEPRHCCPLVPTMCTCDFQACPPSPKNCPAGSTSKLVAKGKGVPGFCCNRYECVAEEG